MTNWLSNLYLQKHERAVLCKGKTESCLLKYILRAKLNTTGEAGKNPCKCKGENKVGLFFLKKNGHQRYKQGGTKVHPLPCFILLYSVATDISLPIQLILAVRQAARIIAAPTRYNAEDRVLLLSCAQLVTKAGLYHPLLKIWKVDISPHRSPWLLADFSRHVNSTYTF